MTPHTSSPMVTVWSDIGFPGATLVLHTAADRRRLRARRGARAAVDGYRPSWADELLDTLHPESAQAGQT